MSKVSLSCSALIDVIPLESLKGAVLLDLENYQWKIISVYKGLLDLESLNKTPSEKPRKRFDPDDYKTIEIELSNYPQLDKSDINRLVDKGRFNITLEDFKSNLLSIDARIELNGIKLNRKDLLLCLAWHGIRNTKQIEFKKLSSLFGEMNRNEANRLISARLAEKAACIFFTSLGFNVEDISIKQLSDEDGRWRDYDLKVNDMPVDVKNARASFSSKDSYSEHTIPRFKIERQFNQECSYFGVFSKYIKPENIDSDSPKCTILGQVNLSYIQKLSAWMANRFGNVLGIQNLFNNKLQPGWIFEYPDIYYSSRTSALDNIDRVLQELTSLNVDKSSIPNCLLILSRDDKFLDLCKPSDSILQIRLDINDLRSHAGITRSSLYCYVLGYFLESIKHKKDLLFVETNILDSIFFSSRESEIARPLGLHDPMHYIFNLIQMLSKMYAKIIESNLSFKAFKLTHPQILRGLTLNDEWVTLYAYCGGWHKETNVRCGAVPIYYGQDEHCKSCGRLICSKCYYCSNDCPEYAKRQYNYRYRYTR